MASVVYTAVERFDAETCSHWPKFLAWSFRDARFPFCGFDLIEEQGTISALTNCGGFDKAFLLTDLSECGLIVEYAKAVAVQELLRAEYPDDPHAFCRVWAIWRMVGP